MDSIRASVGENGKNIRVDVALIQAMLLFIPGVNGGALNSNAFNLDGIDGPNTHASIRKFQSVQLSMQDGLVQPSDFTIKRLSTVLYATTPTLKPWDLKLIALRTVDPSPMDNEFIDVRDGSDHIGKVAALPSGTKIYYQPELGAFECKGLILGKYLELGEEGSSLGYPISDERDWATEAGAKVSYFQNGSIFWSPIHGVRVVAAP